MTQDEPRYLTTREVAELLRVRDRKVYDLAAAGEIPCRRITGKLLFPRDEIEAWLEAGRVGAPPRAEVVAGSHDPLLEWAIRESGCGLATAFDGSLDGLRQMEESRAMMAGIHLFEPETSDWNTGTVRERLGRAPVALIAWARRRQGLLLAPGLGKSVRHIEDLAGLRVARRQPGSGAGRLFDHFAERAGLDATALDLLPDLCRTETEAAAAVVSGAAQAAPGLEALAREYRLDFLPLAEERFDLIVDRRSWFEPPVRKLFAFCDNPEFAGRAERFGGYDISELGTVRFNGA